MLKKIRKVQTKFYSLAIIQKEKRKKALPCHNILDGSWDPQNNCVARKKGFNKVGNNFYAPPKIEMNSHFTINLLIVKMYNIIFLQELFLLTSWKWTEKE